MIRASIAADVRLRVGVLAACLAAVAFSGCAVGSDFATEVTETSATLNGFIYSDKDDDVSYWFVYGKTKGYGSETQHRTITISDRDAHKVSAPIAGLSPGTPYHYTLCNRPTGGAAICSVDAVATTAGSVAELSIEAQPTLYPNFDPAVTDYVTRCRTSPVAIAVSAPSGTTVSVNGLAARGGSFSQDVQLAPGKDFDFSTTTGGNASTYHVRCLPGDFPNWTFSRPGAPSAAYYITTPQGSKAPGGGNAARYVGIFDGHGVPVLVEAGNCYGREAPR